MLLYYIGAMLFVIVLGQYYCMIALGQYYCMIALGQCYLLLYWSNVTVLHWANITVLLHCIAIRRLGGATAARLPPEAKLAPHLDLLDGVHDEHVLQVLHGALHPVVEGRCPLGVFQVQLINGLQLLLCFLWGGKSHVG